MRKLFFSIILLAFGLSAFSQPQSKYAHFIPSYPPVVGESTYNNYVFNHNGLYLHDVILDSLPHYEIEYIPNQTVRFLEDGIGFYVKADSLHSSNVVYSYTVDVPPIGPFEFNANTGRFKFYPDALDCEPFSVTFTATVGSNSLSQTVEFDIIPEVIAENYAIQNYGEMPAAQNLIVAESHTHMFLNNTMWDDTAYCYSYSISGKEIVVENNQDNIVYGLNERQNVYELNLFAEKLYIRSAIKLPQTNVNIYARELIFEDNGGEIASINTTPSTIDTLTNGIGINGGIAGNISLYVGKFTANYAKRFILNGVQGQCANRNGTPGNGGNGGVLSAPINVEGYGDFARGSAGVKYDVDTTIIGAGQAGVNGHFELITDRYSWIHPYYIAAVLRHINDSYLNNYISFSKTTADDYFNLINEFEASDEWEDFDETLKVELQDQETELAGMLYKLNNNLDYFGNPLGWAPMLSFEVLLNNYNDEIDRAMKTFYLNYWLHHIDQTTENWVKASQEAASQTQNRIVTTRDQINVLVGSIPNQEDEIEVVKGQYQDAKTRLEQIEANLMRKARHNVKKKNRINKAFGICKIALDCVPIIGEAASNAASELQTIMGYVPDWFNASDTYGYYSSLVDALGSINDFYYTGSLNGIQQSIQQSINTITLDSLGHIGSNLINNYHDLKNNITPVYNGISNLQKTFSKSSTPKNQVEAEFDRLKKQSAEYQEAVKLVEDFQRKLENLIAHLDQTFIKIHNYTSDVSNGLVTLNALRGDVFEGNSRRDLQAMQCVEKMRQQAMNRLVKYHYYMRKAYEYRLLRPYQGEYSLEDMYNRLEARLSDSIAVHPDWFDSMEPVSADAYSTLSALFRKEVSDVIDEVITDYNSYTLESTVPISYIVPKEWLNTINANGEVVMNLFEQGVFSPNEENIRIVDFEIHYMETHVVGNVGNATYMNLNLEHSGISRFRKDGEVYWFNHIPTSGSNPHTWGVRYDAISNETTTIEPSFASQSLLYSLLEGNSTNMMLFSRPGAWSDIYMSKKVHTTGNADIVIDSLVLTVQYDYTNRSSNIRYIDIATSDDLLAYITCSEADRNGRSNGKGCFHRSYTTSNGTVTFTAEETHGNYHFMNWSDRVGTVVTESTELTVSKSTDQYYRANYEFRIPILNVADTIHVGYEGGEYMVQIQNVGLGDIEMDWYVSDSLSTWVHIEGIAEGIDDGYFTFTYEPFSNQGTRIDSLEILAPEIEGMSKTIYIVQHDYSLSEVITASANPTNGGTVSGGGTYTIGSTCTLTATPYSGFEFVNWTENGEEVSTNATYSFEVTRSRTLVANFENMASHWEPFSQGTSGSMVLIGKLQINGVDQTSNQLELGVFCGNECRGSSLAHLFEYAQLNYYMVDPMVYGDAGDTYTFKLYDHSIGQELVLTSPASITFNENGYGTVFEPYILNFLSAVSVTASVNPENAGTVSGAGEYY